MSLNIIIIGECQCDRDVFSKSRGRDHSYPFGYQPLRYKYAIPGNSRILPVSNPEFVLSCPPIRIWEMMCEKIFAESHDQMAEWTNHDVPCSSAFLEQFSIR
jgi:hypothetical protein